MHLHKLNITFSSMLHIQPYYMEPIPFSVQYNSLQLNSCTFLLHKEYPASKRGP